MHVVGLDLSLTGTGVAKRESTMTISPGSLRGCERLVLIRNEIMRLAIISDIPDFVVIEDRVNFRGDPGATAELHGVVKVALHEWSVPFVVVSPTSLKMYATGKGNAKKEDMKLAAYKRYGREFRTNDECDAFLLMALGLDYAGIPLDTNPRATVTKECRAAMKKVDWSPLTRGGVL